MRLSEAYSTLGLSEGASKDEAKKAFRKLAAKYHPDVNKEPDAESNFKKVNEAYQIIESGKPTTPEPGFGNGPGSDGFGGFGGFDLNNLWDLFGMHQRPRNQKVRFVQDIQLETTISFKDSVLGCKRTVEYDRTVHCDDCEGLGQKNDTNSCKSCNGRGTVIERHGNTIIQSPCKICNGRATYISCNSCSGNGHKDIKYSGTVSVPAGITDSTILRLAGMGHWNGAMYSNTNLKVKVTPEEGLSINGYDVIFNLNLPFIDSLKGTTVKVPTINGLKDVAIPALSRHKEEITLPQLGVRGQGNQRIILNIENPTKVKEIIELLEKE